MRRADRLQKTMSALRCCLDECRRQADPRAALDQCMERLRESADWSAEEIAEVETAARRVVESASFAQVHTV